MATYYCTPADIRANVAGTDDGTGTCAQLDASIVQAKIAQASALVSGYTGATYDPSEIPDLVVSLTVQLATYYATLVYRKSRDLAQYDPVNLGYLDAMATLRAISSGSVSVVPTPPGQPGTPPQASAPRVINTVPRIFGPEDSATEYTPGGRLSAERARGAGWGWPGGRW